MVLGGVRCGFNDFVFYLSFCSIHFWPCPCLYGRRGQDRICRAEFGFSGQEDWKGGDLNFFFFHLGKSSREETGSFLGGRGGCWGRGVS